ncbi:peptide-methionine (S)-S-oxide reductase MsrA [Gluconobacter wancherniae]|uniref:Peptide methionine sulfoxide reductase MsrA n=1 Tax=Gluconobacter wancherniae NBRC 103581 TaxID=656744 RepID=A0A511B6G3_9PROT|nr:peptide-methionine (S)-S-oxide reductase MsrA [Gluconobacter wancherniae]MBF0853548.1 peptide-methionine (S)-S-oxide reductase MsrA [Gluconobacter wancherniae]MBS1063229.1 peptide-methionine (S)-S-oxide reductase MsrA [Gluconobacter wancherniae]MBS1094038.1 peptide-methionine (S)-S-oxide reductase MsrA [Gluconobacter wancherniae]GBD55706.1 peptide methionine sulfoxide reductase MsrA [Gluconobacter wancherniae NBRC 103581]GBR66275.1 methionine sulfoxide reductase A [Gluconobacter wancherniae
MSTHSSILLGGGCFWCVEAVFTGLRGIISADPGYAGGHIDNPSYEAVCTGKTGHAEVVKVVFDATEISLHDVLRVFFTTHDPTQLNRQGNDVGTQYRSVIFGDDAQQQIAREVVSEITSEGIWSAPIVTSIEGPAHFWRAEEKHLDYFARNPETAYCAAVVAPKVAKARKLYRDRLKQPD